MPHKTNGLPGYLPAHTEESSPGDKSDDELMAERCELRRKRLSSFDSSEQSAMRSSLQRFAYNTPTAKRIRCSSVSSPISRLDEENSPTSGETDGQSTAGYVTPSPVKNSFAKIRTTPKKSGHILFSEDSVRENTEHQMENDSNSKQLEAEEDDDVEILTELAPVSSCDQSTSSAAATDAVVSHPSRPFMTSEGYITTRSHSSLLNHVISLAEPPAAPGGSSSGNPTPTNSKNVCIYIILDLDVKF